MKNCLERKQRLKTEYGLNKRQLRSLERLLVCYKITEEAALLELAIREDFKIKRNERIKKLFGERVNDFKDAPIIKIK